ncbi:MAG: undecaprenyl-phosphate glucose phosphotransferase [Proteobacteria bacterium]|nr:undecaprenyl-phosphate glucose phosphotransferase [Pseudomonadota bacterium]
MDAKVANTGGAAAKGRAKLLSPAVVGDLLRLFDVAVILIVGIGIYFLYVNRIYPDAPISRYLVTLVISAALGGVLFQWFGVYAGDYIFTRRLRIDRMISAWAVTFALLLTIAFALKITDFYSRIWAVSWYFVTAVLLILGRLMLGSWIRNSAREGRFAKRTAIVGTGPQASRIADHLRENDKFRTEIVGFADDRADDRDREEAAGDTVPASLGGIEDLVRMIRDDAIDRVVIALPWNDPERMRGVVQRLAVTPVPIHLAPDLAGFDYTGRDFTNIAGLPVLHLFDRPISGWSQLTKTAEDRVLATLFLILLSPLFLVLPLVIKLTSPGPILFKQKRYGFNDQLIEVWKFRTMYHHLEDAEGNEQATKADVRVTPVGRFLRRTSLDELPQLFNVLKGDMSLVGPRPHPVATKAGGQLFYDVVDQYAARHRVKPGITGWAQVSGWRGETRTVEEIEKRVECDLYYIDNWSIWFDIRIIAKTVVVIFRDAKAY